MCTALLEAAGILPDAQGRRIGVQGKQAAGDGAAGEVGGGGAMGGEAGIAGAAAAVRYLHSRRQLYDAMETALLERGLVLGGCWHQQGCYHVAQCHKVGHAPGCCVCCCMLAQSAGIIKTPPFSPRFRAPVADASSTQGMGLGDMFRRGADGQLQPVLRELEVPVRAVVLPIGDAQAAR